MTREEVVEAAFAVLNALEATRASTGLRGVSVIAKLEDCFTTQCDIRVRGLSEHVGLATYKTQLAPVAKTATGARIMKEVLSRLEK